MRSRSLFSSTRFLLFAIAGIAALSFFPFLGNTHLFDWDEINFAESAREMLVTGDFLRVRINFEPFWEKPPLFFWMQALAMQVMGVNEWAARFPNALFGIITLLTLFLIGKREKDLTFGLFWTFFYAASFLPHLYFRSGIIDPIFNYFIFLGVYFLYKTVSADSKSISTSAFAGIATGLSILTKGPVGFLLVLLTFTVLWISRKITNKIAHYQEVVVFAFSTFLVSFLWFGWETIQNGPWYLVEFIQYQIALFSQPVAGHDQPWYYHAVVIFVGCFPASIFGLTQLFQFKSTKDLDRWMLVLFWVVLLLFSYVTTKIVHYSSMTYLPLSYLAAKELHHWHEFRSIKKWVLWLFGVLGSLWALLFGITTYVLNRPAWLTTWVKGSFAKASLTVSVDLSGWEWMIGILLFCAVLAFIYLINKRRYFGAVIIYTLSVSLSLTLFAGYVLPAIESFSQGPAIEFFESHQQESAYLMTEGHKSYAPYFYGRVEPYENPNAKDKKWLLTGPIDRPVYIAVKVNKAERMAQYPDIIKLYAKGGFVFYRRDPVMIE